MKHLALLLSVMLALVAVVSVSAEIIQPLAVKNASVGGGDIIGTPTKGVEGGQGLNNIGLLIRTWGTVTYRDTVSKFFYINDGSNLNDGNTLGVGGTAVLGLRVSYENLAAGVTINPPDVNTFVAVTGISSTYADSNIKIRPNLRPRSQNDVN
ncbi:MAG: hypothetical protein M1133_06245 [Armatimonadetes bacterium]|nr:hypothetical protein [Armatimonadota bacterium]